MNATELADEFKKENNDWNEDNLRHWGKQTEAMLRQQQTEIEALTKFLDETCQIGEFIVWNSTDKAQEK